MNRKVRLLGFTLGDPMSPLSRSGVNYQVFSRLSQQCQIVGLFDLDLRGLRKIYSALSNFSFDRGKWGSRLHQNPWAFNVRTSMAEEILKKLDGNYDLIYQDGAMFIPGMNAKRHFVSYHDCNVILSAGGGVYAQGAHYKGNALAKTIEQERLVYNNAKIIFTMSDWLKTSLVKDFGIPEKKIITVYAGTNLRPQHFEKTYDGNTILFVGKNFERKGGPTLLRAFRAIRKEIPEARLIIIGPRLNINEEGVSVPGPINNAEVLSGYFREASVFVLPSCFEPFGIVFAEAFAFQTPCIGTDLCAMPEIIEHGKGGYVVPPHDPEILAKRIIEILRDEALAREMGQYGFRKAVEIFNWDIVLKKMLFYISDLVQ